VRDAAQGVQFLHAGVQILVAGRAHAHPVYHRRDLGGNRRQQVYVALVVGHMGRAVGDGEFADAAILDGEGHLHPVAQGEAFDQRAVLGQHTPVRRQVVAEQGAPRDEHALLKAGRVGVHAEGCVEGGSPHVLRVEHQRPAALFDQGQRHIAGLRDVGDGDEHFLDGLLGGDAVRGHGGDGPQPFGPVRAALHLGVEAGVVNEHGRLPGEDGQQVRVVLAEAAPVAPVGYLDDAQPPSAGLQRCHDRLAHPHLGSQRAQCRLRRRRVALQIVAQPGIAFLPQPRDWTFRWGGHLVEAHTLLVVHAEEGSLADQHLLLAVIEQDAA